LPHSSQRFSSFVQDRVINRLIFLTCFGFARMRTVRRATGRAMATTPAVGRAWMVANIVAIWMWWGIGGERDVMWGHVGGAQPLSSIERAGPCLTWRVSSLPQAGARDRPEASARAPLPRDVQSRHRTSRYSRHPPRTELDGPPCPPLAPARDSWALDCRSRPRYPCVTRGHAARAVLAGGLRRPGPPQWRPVGRGAPGQSPGAASGRPGPSAGARGRGRARRPAATQSRSTWTGC